MIEPSVLASLNEEYYELYGRLFENHEVMDESAYKLISQKLFEGYKDDYELLARKSSIAYKQDMFETKTRCGKKIPRVFLFFRNRAARTTARELELELGEYFRKRDVAIEQRKAEEERQKADKAAPHDEGAASP